MIEQLNVYFIDQYNFPGLCESAEKGDALACTLVHVLSGFVDDAPPPVCAMCDNHVIAAEVPSMTIVIIMHTKKESLTSWICEECAARDDLNDEIEKVIRRWSAIPKDAIVRMVDRKTTLH